VTKSLLPKYYEVSGHKVIVRGNAVGHGAANRPQPIKSESVLMATKVVAHCEAIRRAGSSWLNAVVSDGGSGCNGLRGEATA
jgi:hypothetical protein